MEQLTDDDVRGLAAAGVRVVPGEVAEVVAAGDRLTGVALAEGPAYDRDVLCVAPRAVPRTDLLARLGAELRETPFGTYPVIDERGLTTAD